MPDLPIYHFDSRMVFVVLTGLSVEVVEVSYLSAFKRNWWGFKRLYELGWLKWTICVKGISFPIKVLPHKLCYFACWRSIYDAYPIKSVVHILEQFTVIKQQLLPILKVSKAAELATMPKIANGLQLVKLPANLGLLLQGVTFFEDEEP